MYCYNNELDTRMHMLKYQCSTVKINKKIRKKQLVSMENHMECYYWTRILPAKRT